LVDLVSARYTKSNFCQGGWEWINSGPIGIPKSTATGIKSGNKNLIACRERQLSADESWLASRELVIDLHSGVCQDLFYQLRLYELEEMEILLEKCGLSLHTKDCKQLSGPTTDRNGDLGMMAARHLLVAQKTELPENSEAMDDVGMVHYINQSLVVATDPIKGRMIRTTIFLKAGTLLMKDNPYALTPDVEADSGDLPTCSRLEYVNHPGYLPSNFHPSALC